MSAENEKKNYQAKEKSPINPWMALSSEITTKERVTKSETIPNGKKQLAQMAEEKAPAEEN